MPFFLNDDGTVSHYDWGDDRAHDLMDAMAPYWGTLAGACHDGRVQATAFSQAIEVEVLFDGELWFKTGENVPIGRRAEYQIDFFDGCLLYRRNIVENLVSGYKRPLLPLAPEAAHPEECLA